MANNKPCNNPLCEMTSHQGFYHCLDCLITIDQDYAEAE
jgi:hypothetical protein